MAKIRRNCSDSGSGASDHDFREVVKGEKLQADRLFEHSDVLGR
jgi:hypothetical protein